MSDIRKNVPVLIVGASGTGKSSSVGIQRNEAGEITAQGLPPEQTMIINTENQPLPVENFEEFTNAYTTTWKKIEKVLNLLIKAGEKQTPEEKAKMDKHFAENPNKPDLRKIKYVVFDSLTSATEIILKYTSTAFDGYEIWGQYNLLIQTLLTKIKDLPQQVFITSIPEVKEIGFGDTKNYARVRGKELKYGIEKEFVIVLFTNPVYDDEEGFLEDANFKYRANKFDTTKAPPGMFKGKLHNDLAMVDKGIKAFYAKKVPTKSN